MKLFTGNRKFFKALVLGVLVSMMCVLTFICDAPTIVDATDNVENVDSPAKSNEPTDKDNSYLEGDLGGLTFRFSGDGTGSLSATLQILLLLTIISLAPSILVMLTSFTRIVIVMHFLRTALGTQTTPPNQVLIGLSLFLTLFIMAPTFNEINTVAVQPLARGDIGYEEAFDLGMAPIREFMFDQMDGSEKDLSLFLEIAGIDSVESRDDVPTRVLIPAFILSELRIAFTIGFLIYIPFLIIDMVVSSTLMSMGMMMLPPVQISMPFKLMLFVLVDGWGLLTQQLFNSVIR